MVETVAGKKSAERSGGMKAVNKRQQSKEATRQRIMKAAIDVFYDEGYLSTNVVEIAKKAGVSVGAVFFHFNDKRSLFVSTIREANLRYVARLEGAVDRISNSRRGIIEKIEAITQSHLKIAMAYTEFYTSAIHEIFIVDLEFDLIPKEMCQSIIAKLENLIEEGIDERIFSREVNTKAVAHLLFYIPIVTLSRRGLSGDTKRSLPARCSETVHSLMNGMLARQGEPSLSTRPMAQVSSVGETQQLSSREGDKLDG